MGYFDDNKFNDVIQRVNRILNPKLQVPKPMGRFAWAALFTCSMPVIYLSAAVTLAPVVPGFSLQGLWICPFCRNGKSPVRMIAQEIPKRPSSPAAPLNPPRPEDPPITKCILLDNRGSMRDKRAAVKAAALAVVKSLRPDDEFCVGR